uniref:Uncharacterized protein n=1 Tax=Anguilla anguilla TaxID=7936 RepID=A0A0E9RUX6_ANGAN
MRQSIHFTHKKDPKLIAEQRPCYTREKGCCRHQVNK